MAKRLSGFTVGLMLLAAGVGTALHGQDKAPVSADNPGIGSGHDAWWHGYMSAPQIVLPDGRHLTLFCEGQGTPTVVLDIGLGGAAWGWSTVQDAMARQTRVCSYDRAGYSNSDPAKGPRTFDALAADLDALLLAAKLPGPYVMVGQSLGGPIVGLYAQRHSDKVAGLVLIDPSVGKETSRLSAIAPDQDDQANRIAVAKQCVGAVDRGELRPGSAIEKLCVAPDRPGFTPPAFAAPTYRAWQRGSNLRAKLAETEGIDFDKLQWPRGARTDGPVLVLTATDTFAGNPKAGELWALWKAMHDEVAGTSPDGLNCVVPRSTHAMMASRPDAVIDAVAATVDAVRSHRPIAFHC